MVLHVGCHRNVSLIGTRPQSGENKTAASVVPSAWQREPRMGGGAEVSHGEEGANPKVLSSVWERLKDSEFSEGRKGLSR